MTEKIVMVSAEEQKLAEELGDELPATLPVLPLKDTVVFPTSMTPLAIGQERSIALIDDVVAGDRLLALVAVENDEAEMPGWDDLYRVGTAAVVHKMLRVPDGTLRVLVQGLRRVHIDRLADEHPYLVAELTELPDQVEESKELEALARNVQGMFAGIVGVLPYLPEELRIATANVDDPSALCSLVASTIRLKTEERQGLLELVDVGARLHEISLILAREVEMIELGSKIQSQMQSELDKGQREFFLRQQLKTIQEELGEDDPEQAEVNELRAHIDELDLPEGVEKAATR
jgi:ATP-dependent Lon protease